MPEVASPVAPGLLGGLAGDPGEVLADERTRWTVQGRPIFETQRLQESRGTRRSWEGQQLRHAGRPESGVRYPRCESSGVQCGRNRWLSWILRRGHAEVSYDHV